MKKETDTEPTPKGVNKSFINRRLDMIETDSPESLLWDFWVRGTSVMQNTYTELKNKTLSDCLNLWQTRFNGYSINNPDLMFINYSRDMVINYIGTIANNPPKVKIKSKNKVKNTPNKILGDILTDVNEATNQRDDVKGMFRDFALSVAVKGTGIMYEGYKRLEVEDEEIEDFDPSTGNFTTAKRSRIIFDDVYQEEIPVEDLLIMNPYVNSIHDQPAIIWRKMFDIESFVEEFGEYEGADEVLPGVTYGAGQSLYYGNNTNNIHMSTYQVEVLRFYHRLKNRHIICAGGKIIYDGPMPFKHRKYPFEKAIHKPSTTNFFWGMSLIEEVRGQQDTLNSVINMMDEKTQYSLKPFILTSDDDMSDQEEFNIGDIKKVSDVAKWVVKEMPGVNQAESNYFSQVQTLLKELAGVYGGADSFTKNGGKLDIRQIMLQEQQANKVITFSSTYLEEYEARRTKLRLYNILQFYSVPRVEKYSGIDGKIYKKLVYKNAQLNPKKEGDPIKSVYFQNAPTEEEKNQTFDAMEQAEDLSESQGIPLKTSLVDASMFDDHDFDIEVEKSSSWLRNDAMEQQKRLEYGQYIINAMQQAMALGQQLNIDINKVTEYIQESFDIPFYQFVMDNVMQQQVQQNLAAQQNPEQAAQGQPQEEQPLPTAIDSQGNEVPQVQ